MGFGYDIFKKLQDGSPIWITPVTTLEEARNRVNALLSAERAQYFIHNASTGEVLPSTDHFQDKACTDTPKQTALFRCKCGAQPRPCVEFVTT
jgi:hypothetical protein